MKRAAFCGSAILVAAVLCVVPKTTAAAEPQKAAKAEPDPLGVHLPATLSAQVIESLLVPASDHQKVNLVGAKAWSGLPNSYVAIVCTGGSLAQGGCSYQAEDASSPLHLYLGVITVAPGSPPKLVAKSARVEDVVDWNDSGLAGAEEMMGAFEPAEGAKQPLRPQKFIQFDLAPYKIAPNVTAIGLRGEWFDASSGGGAYYDSLHLFAIDGDQLKPILAVPISYVSDTSVPTGAAGAREHDVDKGDNVIVIAPQQTDGYFDLVLKNTSRTGQWRSLYHWSKAAGVYRSEADTPQKLAAEAKARAAYVREDEQGSKKAANAEMTDRGAGVLQQAGSGLLWTQKDNGSETDWNGARKYCSSLTAVGGGWRVPASAELQSLLNGSNMPEAHCGDHVCAISPRFTLSGVSVWGSDSAGSGVLVNLFIGEVGKAPTSDTGRVLCVKRP
jgi:Protein of unknown function (DUF1566)